MLKITFITVGTLSEAHWRAACEEYKKRLSGMAAVLEVQIKEERLKNDPSPCEISRALNAEGERILAAIPAKSLVVPLCVEGRALSSEELAARIDGAASSGKSGVCFIIGSSFGLSDKVKSAADLKLSLSALTLPHQLARVVLYEATYRALSINAGTKYHK